MNAGVKSSIWSLLALSWSWNRASTSTAPTPTSFIRILVLRGTLKLDAPSRRLGVADPTDRHGLAEVESERRAPSAESRTNSSAFLGLASRPLGHHDPILVETQPVHAAVGADPFGGGERLVVLARPARR